MPHARQTGNSYYRVFHLRRSDLKNCREKVHFPCFILFLTSSVSHFISSGIYIGIYWVLRCWAGECWMARHFSSAVKWLFAAAEYALTSSPCGRCSVLYSFRSAFSGLSKIDSWSQAVLQTGINHLLLASRTGKDLYINSFIDSYY